MAPPANPPAMSEPAWIRFSTGSLPPGSGAVTLASSLLRGDGDYEEWRAEAIARAQKRYYEGLREGGLPRSPRPSPGSRPPNGGWGWDPGPRCRSCSSTRAQLRHS